MKYYTETDIEKEIYKEIELLKNLAVKSDSKTYISWYYPLIKECLYILVRFDIKSFAEIDKLFDELDKEIKSKLEGSR